MSSLPAQKHHVFTQSGPRADIENPKHLSSQNLTASIEGAMVETGHNTFSVS